MTSLVEEIQKVHPKIEVTTFHHITYLTEVLENEPHPQIVYTLDDRRKELKIAIGTYVVIILYRELEGKNIQELLFKHAMEAQLSNKYLTYISY